ncbi:MAG: class I SAM-dependent methyltransferase [Gemmatimonadota bacterium]|nr:class I SAM-dependent methyltransferase [Gemmatimonadota bacterium]
MIDDSYRSGAKHYDAAYSVKDDLVDRDFYLDLANEYGGPVLEFGCGTGRITLLLARRGVDVTGMDASHSMLEVLRAKLAKERESVRRRTRVIEGDFRTHYLGGQFSLVVIPFRPMQHMYTTEDQLAALKNARRHLADGGILAFDVFNPSFAKILTGIGEEYLDLEWPAQDGTDRMVRRYFVKDEIDLINLNFSGRFIFRLCEGDKVLSEEAQPLKMSFYTYPHLKLLFYAAGLESVGEFGSFDRKPIGPEAPEMIFLLKRRQ